MRTRQTPWAVALVGVVLGFMLATQFKVHQQAALREATGYQRAQELVGQLQKAEQERDALMGEMDELRVQMRAMASNQAEFRDLAAQLELAQLYAGMIALTGPGIVITMNDSTRPTAPGENPNNFIIHDEDVLRVINELAAAGAEAVAINEQRLTSRSEIRCTGPTITINGVRTAPPIVIKAIGDPAALEAAINMRGAVGESLRQWGIQVTVKKESSLTVPPYKGSLKLLHGTPVSQEVKP